MSSCNPPCEYICWWPPSFSALAVSWVSIPPKRLRFPLGQRSSPLDLCPLFGWLPPPCLPWNGAISCLGCYLNVLDCFAGAGYSYMRTFERLLRGLWIPSTNEILQPSLWVGPPLPPPLLHVVSPDSLQCDWLCRWLISSFCSSTVLSAS